tara:strand:+ start:215 stop:481 length:267 start_codon:yes stop_codon:yes gene_type:complete
MAVSKEKKYAMLLVKSAKTSKDKQQLLDSLSQLSALMKSVPVELFSAAVNSNKALSETIKKFVKTLQESRSLYLIPSVLENVKEILKN